MSRKNFTEGIDAVLGGRISSQDKKQASHPSTNKSERTSVVLSSELIEKLRAIAFWERSTIKIEMENAIKCYLEEKKSEVVEKALHEFREKKG